MNKSDFQILTDHLPQAREKLNRLAQLMEHTGDARIAVFGKYNHGKSTLLNALVGRQAFKASDRRETRAIDKLIHDGIVWIDTPGLDADVYGEDDRLAREGAFELADYLLLVHNVKAGELDRYELDLYQKMMACNSNHSARTYLVLTQIDQVSTKDFDQVSQRIQGQLPDASIIPVSAHRYQRGTNEGKATFIELSGMNALLEQTQQMKQRLHDSRQQELEELRHKLRQQIQQRVSHLKADLSHRKQKGNKNRRRFISRVDQTLSKIATFG